MQQKKTLSEPVRYTNFNGTKFYQRYEKSLFLKSSKGKKFVLKVLSSAVQMKHMLKDVTSITLKGIKLNDKDDLVVKKGSRDQVIMDFDFTLKRLQGFCAAYAYTQWDRFDHNTVVAVAASLGYELKADSTEDFRKFYFSFAPGAENFSYILGFWPVVALLTHVSEKKNQTKIKMFLRKFKVKGDDKVKLMYQIKEKDAIARILPVVSERADGEKINFSDCLKTFQLPN